VKNSAGSAKPAPFVPQQLHFDTIAGDFVDLTQPTGEQLAEAVKRVPLLTAEQLAEVYSRPILSNRG
jgi:hypothetical protein